MIDYYHLCVGIDYSQDTMKLLRDNACDILCANFPDTPARTSFIALLDFIIARTR